MIENGNKGETGYMRKKLGTRQILGFMSIALLLVIAGAALQSAAAADSNEHAKLRAAPPNPEFIRYVARQQADTQWPDVTADGYPLGHIPAPVNVDYFYTFDDDINADQIDLDSLPAQYDLRTQNKLTVVC